VSIAKRGVIENIALPLLEDYRLIICWSADQSCLAAIYTKIYFIDEVKAEWSNDRSSRKTIVNNLLNLTKKKRMPFPYGKSNELFSQSID
jgi:hypothetical protein